MSDNTRTQNRLIAEGIHPSRNLEGGKPDAATIYRLSEEIKREMNKWIDFVGIEEVLRITRFAKPRHTDHAKDIIKSHVDNRLNKLNKLQVIRELISEDKQAKAWNEILG